MDESVEAVETVMNIQAGLSVHTVRDLLLPGLRLFETQNPGIPLDTQAVPELDVILVVAYSHGTGKGQTFCLNRDMWEDPQITLKPVLKDLIEAVTGELANG